MTDIGNNLIIHLKMKSLKGYILADLSTVKELLNIFKISNKDYCKKKWI